MTASAASAQLADAGSRAGRAFYLPPSWLGIDRDGALELTDCASGDRVELNGRMREELLLGQRPAALAAMARLDPRLARLKEALDGQPLAPLDRAALLRGSGFDQLFLELTARCNERCVHCYAESSPERSEALELETVQAVIDDAAALGFERIQFTGGDPLVSAHLEAAVAYAAQRGLRAIEIYTNGLALSERLLERLRPHGVAFAFSFYSADAAVHDAITRTPGSQRRTAAAIERVLRAGLTARASIIVMEQNQGQVDATRALLRSLGLSDGAIGMDVQRSVGRGLMTLRPREGGIPAGTGAGHRDVAPTTGPGRRFEGRAAVAYDGTVYPCIFSRAFALGDVRSRPLRDILREPVPLAYDDALLWAEVGRREAQLACWECRLRGAALALQAPPVRPL